MGIFLLLTSRSTYQLDYILITRKLKNQNLFAVSKGDDKKKKTFHCKIIHPSTQIKNSVINNAFFLQNCCIIITENKITE